MLSIGSIALTLVVCWISVWAILASRIVRLYLKETRGGTEINTSLSKKELQRMRDQTEGRPDYKTAAKITFEQFASFYAINPDAWMLHEWYVDRLPSKEDMDEARKAVCGFYKVPLDGGDKLTIESINSIVRSQIFPQLCKRVYFSSEEDTKTYHAFYEAVQEEMKRKAEEEKRQRELQAETKNTAEVIKMVTRDIEAAKDLALKQRRQAVDMLSSIANGDTKRQRDKELERTKKQVEADVERMNEHFKTMTEPRRNAWTQAADKKGIPYAKSNAGLFYGREHVGVVQNLSSEIHTLPDWWKRSYGHLYLGVHSNYVKYLQKALNIIMPSLVRSHVYIPIEEDGWFGNRTDSVVREFQGIWHLKSDGIVGPDTYRAIETALGRAEEDNPHKKVTTSNPAVATR